MLYVAYITSGRDKYEYETQVIGLLTMKMLPKEK